MSNFNNLINNNISLINKEFDSYSNSTLYYFNKPKKSSNSINDLFINAKAYINQTEQHVKENTFEKDYAIKFQTKFNFMINLINTVFSDYQCQTELVEKHNFKIEELDAFFDSLYSSTKKISTSLDNSRTQKDNDKPSILNFLLQKMKTKSSKIKP